MAQCLDNWLHVLLSVGKASKPSFRVAVEPVNNLFVAIWKGCTRKCHGRCQEVCISWCSGRAPRTGWSFWVIYECLGYIRKPLTRGIVVMGLYVMPAVCNASCMAWDWRSAGQHRFMKVAYCCCPLLLSHICTQFVGVMGSEDLLWPKFSAFLPNIATDLQQLSAFHFSTLKSEFILGGGEGLCCLGLQLFALRLALPG